jgi:hypothetical protein
MSGKSGIEMLREELAQLKGLPTSEDLYEEYFELMTRCRTVLGDDLHPEMAAFYFQYGSYLYDKCVFTGDLFGNQVPPQVKRPKKKKSRARSEQKVVFKNEDCEILEEQIV